MIARLSISFGLLCLFGLLGWGVLKALQTFENDVASWLPAEDSQDEFSAQFGAEAFLVVSWDDSSYDDARLQPLSDELFAIQVESDAPAFDQLTSAASLLDSLTTGPAGLTVDEAAKRLQGWMIGQDGETSIFLRLTDEGWDARHDVLNQVEEICYAQGIARENLRLGGPLKNSVEVDRMGMKNVAPLAGLCFVVTFVLMFATLRSAKFVFPVVVYANFAWMTSLCLLYLLSGKLDSILIALPAMVYVLSASAAIHMTGYYQSAVNAGDSRPILSALKLGFAPCSIASLTTLVGLASLTISQMIPVSNFGYFSSMGILAAWAGIFTLWPLCLSIVTRPAGFSSKAEEPEPESQTDGRTWWSTLFEFSTRHAFKVVSVSALAVPFLLYGISQIQTSVGVADMFGSKTDARQDYEWFESKIAGLIPLEVVLSFPLNPDEELNTLLAKLRLIRQVHEFAAAQPDVTGTFAPTTFMPRIPSEGGFQATVTRRIIGAKVRAAKKELLQMNLLSESTDQEHWRITCRVPGLKPELDHAKFLGNFEQETNDYLISLESPLEPRLRVTGGGFQVARAQRLLLTDMGKSMFLAFALIAIAMVLICKSLRLGFIAMIPNIFPTLLVFGSMGLAGVRLDAGAMITATVALGIAVDDTSHFVWWFSRSRKENNSVQASVFSAFRHCATPMLRTTIICGLGLGLFAFSPFLPIARFGGFMATLLVAALLGDLLLFPALLVLAKQQSPSEITQQNAA